MRLGTGWDSEGSHSWHVVLVVPVQGRAEPLVCGGWALGWVWHGHTDLGPCRVCAVSEMQVVYVRVLPSEFPPGTLTELF